MVISIVMVVVNEGLIIMLQDFYEYLILVLLMVVVDVLFVFSGLVKFLEVQVNLVVLFNVMYFFDCGLCDIGCCCVLLILCLDFKIGLLDI